MASDTANEFVTYIDDYVEEHDCHGTNGYGDNNIAFIPRVALANFWTEENIVSILCNHEKERIRGDVSEILTNYLIVFSVLVTVGKPQLITSFLSSRTALTDRELPFEGVPGEWSDDSEKRGTFEEFEKVQWRFCPLVFDQRMYKSAMSPNRIVPVMSKKLVDPDADEEEDDVLVYEANWHPDCLGFLPSSKVIFKEYRDRDRDVITTLENEIDIYTNLGETGFDHIVRYFGSFEQQGKITIVLEYASGGNLVEFWEKTPPPTNAEDKLDLWDSFFQLLLALEATHNLGPTHETEDRAGQWRLKGIHQDIRPQNILITGVEPNSYRIYFKLTDFGTGHVRRCRRQGMDPMGEQRRGNGMYSAPESYRDNSITRPQLCECDIWSLGGVASEFLVWSIRGDRRRREYQERRCEATGKTVLAGGYHEGSFHNSQIRLQVVDDEHGTIDKNDLVSQAASRIILRHMLIADVAHRSNAIETYKNWKGALHFFHNQRRRPSFWGETRGSRYSLELSPSKRRSVDSHRSLQRGLPPRVDGQSWLDNDHQAAFSAEPGVMASGSWTTHGHSGVLSGHLDHGSRVGFAQEGGNGEGSSTSHGPGTGVVYRSQRGTRDSMRHASSFPSIPETSQQVQGSHNPAQSAPILSNRSATGLTANSGLASPPSAFRQRRGADEFHSVAGFEESSASNEQVGLGVKINPEPASHIPSPPITPHKKTDRRSSNNPVRSSTEGLQRAPTIRRAQTTLTITEAAKITINDVYEKIRSEKGKQIYSPLRKTRPNRLLTEFPRLADALMRLKGLDGREQVFIIDDSESMRHHSYDMGRTLRVLARLLKVGEVDPDKYFTVYYACTLGKVSFKNARDLEKSLLDHTFSNEPYNFGVQLDAIVTDISKASHPVSIYVLTNGRWNAARGQPQNLCKVDSVIERVLKTNKADPLRQMNHVGFQFIRFYRRAGDVDDDEGKQRLDFLDNCLPAQFENLGMPKSDIIDTTDWDEDVRKMLLGGVFTEEDDAVTEAAGQPGPSERT